MLVGGFKYYVQSQVLALWSPYFERLFSSSSQETTQIQLTNVDPFRFPRLLNYIYPHEEQQEIDAFNVYPLMDLSDRFEVTLVFERCRSFLKSTSLLDVFQIMKLADTYKLIDVQESALDRLLLVPNLMNYIEKHKIYFNILPLSVRYDVLNVLLLRKRP